MVSQTKSSKLIKCTRCDKTALRGRPNSLHCYDCVKAIKKTYRDHKKKVVSRWKRMKGCAKCGWNEHPAALHIDHIHVNPKKGKGYDPQQSWSRIKENLSKCQVLCANCHGIKTYEEARHLKGNLQ